MGISGFQQTTQRRVSEHEITHVDIVSNGRVTYHAHVLFLHTCLTENRNVLTC